LFKIGSYTVDSSDNLELIGNNENHAIVSLNNVVLVSAKQKSNENLEILTKECLITIDKEHNIFVSKPENLESVFSEHSHPMIR
jgi:hypothetical protein